MTQKKKYMRTLVKFNSSYYINVPKDLISKRELNLEAQIKGNDVKIMEMDKNERKSKDKVRFV